MACLGENWGLEFSRQQINQALKDNKILSLELELSRLCNLRCIYCYADSGCALDNELTLAELYSIIDQAALLGAQKIIVLGGGEPVLFADLFLVLDYILAKGMSADLFTNGTLVSREVAEQLFQRGIGVVIKQNSQQPEVQDLLAGQQGAYEKIQQGLKNLRRAGYPDQEHLLGIETIICRQNYDEIPQLWRWARQHGIIPYVEKMTMQGRATKNIDLEVSSDQMRQLFESLAAIDRAEFQMDWTPHPPLASSQCARHEYSCTVTSTGDINPCPGVNIAVGNIRQQSLQEILASSPVMQDLRNIRQTIKGRCNSCDFSDHCYGCRGHAYQVSGDYLAEDVLCWLKNP